MRYPSVLLLGTVLSCMSCTTEPPSVQSSEKQEFTTVDPDFEWKVSNPFPFSDGYRLSMGSGWGESSYDEENNKDPAEFSSNRLSSSDLDEFYRNHSAFFALKDPSLVKHDNEWHLFCTRRAVHPSHSIEYLKLKNISDKVPVERKILPFAGKRVRAPQVFYFTPHQTWYLIFQKKAVDFESAPALPFYTTNEKIDNSSNWSKPEQMRLSSQGDSENWGDFWFISDQKYGYLFMTSKEGKFFRSKTSLLDFPDGWSEPVLCLEGDFIEGGHVYWIEEWQRYMVLLVASRYFKRYHKAYVAEDLDGPWEHFAVTRTQAFISRANVEFNSETPWADSFGHGELLRSSPDELMCVSTKDLSMIIPAVLREEMNDKLYREVPWKLTRVNLISARAGLVE
jgi:hypothetical protein